ncbi:ATP-dependent DNA helicase chl1 [Coemansia sp. RSA 485]|nr:ATP-dependent DNA helicase chl1 [Coemansia sp. RSA 485]
MTAVDPPATDTQINTPGRLCTPQTATEFSFPFTPYTIQLEFMQRLFETLEEGRFAIFESPTGTGKSLSIICGALTWLMHHNKRQETKTTQSSNGLLAHGVDDQPEWVREYERKQRDAQRDIEGMQVDEKRRRYDGWVARTRRKEAAEMRGRRMGAFGGGSGGAQPSVGKRKTREEINDGLSDSDMVVDAYESDPAASGNNAEDKDPVQYSDSVRRLLRKKAAGQPYGDSDSSDSDNDPDEVPEEPEVTKIFYASRTHSQLQQFVGELKRTDFAKENNVRCVTLGSRMQLCGNEAVRSKCQSVGTLNERCLELQQNNKKKRCPMLPTRHTPMLDYKDAVNGVMDIEDLVTEGRKMSVCAYYGSRNSVNSAHVVALPYNMLLSKSARQSMNLSLKDHVVVVDEAHNLVDTVLAIHSVSLDCQTVKTLLGLVQRYWSKYWKRMNSGNAGYVRQTMALLKALAKYMAALTKSAQGNESAEVVSVNEFLHRAHADHFNVYKIDRYLRTSKLGRKLNMFADSVNQTSEEDIAQRAKKPMGAVPVAPATAVAMFETFMQSIGNPERRGARIVVRVTTVSNEQAQVELKYLLLDPSDSFGDICREARAVVLAGGTMQPTDDVISQLLPTNHTISGQPELMDPNNARLFAWNHVVHKSHVAAVVVGSGPTGQQLRFTYHDQMDAKKLRDAGNALAALCAVVPGGVVVFFPSYQMLLRMHEEWASCGVIARIERKKSVFAEQPSNGDSGILDRYTVQVQRPGSAGAVLLSVVGGRLSEGINFSDDLGRAVVMIGVPFPSLKSPELAERLAFYDNHQRENAKAAAEIMDGKMGNRARELYESLCMRAVNQSIGRVIRHRGDYAAVVFLDCRYADQRIARKLPAWIVDGQQNTNALAFGPAISRIAMFFKQDFTATKHV